MGTKLQYEPQGGTHVRQSKILLPETQRELEENETESQIKHTIEHLVMWADELNSKDSKDEFWSRATMR